MQVHSYSIEVSPYTKLHSMLENFVEYENILELTSSQKQPLGYRETNCLICSLYFCLPHLSFSLFLYMPLGLSLLEQRSSLMEGVLHRATKGAQQCKCNSSNSFK